MSPAERKQLEEIYKIIFSLKQRVNAARASIEKKESASKTEEETGAGAGAGAGATA